MASAFVTFASCATTAPLNPAYRRQEFDFYLSDLGARALVVAAGTESPAVDSAVGLGIPILQIEFDAQGPAGRFELHGQAGAAVGASAGGVAGPDDVALVLHTSGTTSRPKIVPLTQRNVCASARNIRATLSLERADRCLNVMPLFHIHGLMAAVLATFRAGASVSCTPGFNALKFFAWMQEVRPSWYTAVPTMHQAILARAPRNQEIVDGAGLRFIRDRHLAIERVVERPIHLAHTARTERSENLVMAEPSSGVHGRGGYVSLACAFNPRTRGKPEARALARSFPALVGTVPLPARANTEPNVDERTSNYERR